MTFNELDVIERNISEAKKLVDLADSLERLRENRDFKKVVLEGYFEKEAIRLVLLKADPNFQTPERQDSIWSQIDAIGNLHQYFQTIYQQAAIARKSIEADEAIREEILAEDLSNG